jgi:hypothetical protein
MTMDQKAIRLWRQLGLVFPGHKTRSGQTIFWMTWPSGSRLACVCATVADVVKSVAGGRESGAKSPDSG